MPSDPDPVDTGMTNSDTQHRWIGRWRNQYGSILVVTDDSGGAIAGTFETALGDSSFAGVQVPVTGVHLGNCVNFAFVRSSDTGDSIASFTGLLRDGKLETLWHVINDRAVKSPSPGAPPQLIELPWAHAALTNADTFERVE